MKARIENMPIRRKIILYLLAFCFVMFALIWAFQVMLLPQFYQFVRQKQAAAAASRIENELITLYNSDKTPVYDGDSYMAIVDDDDQDNYDDDDDDDDFQSVGQWKLLGYDSETAEEINNISRAYDASYIVLSPSGSILFSEDVMKMSSIHRMSLDEILSFVRKAEEDGTVSELLESSPGGEKIREFGLLDSEYRGEKDPMKMIVLCKKVTADSRTIAYILVNMQITPVSTIVYAIRYSLYRIIAIMLVFAVILSVILSNRIAGPIRKVTEQASKLAEGKYETVFDAKGYKEINNLSETLTYTASELGKVDKLRQDFIANVSHDLRTPLTLISGYAEVMRDIPGENNSENAQIIIDESKRLSSLVNDVLDMSKIQSGALPMQPFEYDIVSSTEEIVHRVSEMLKNQNYNISFEGKDEVFITADKDRIDQCVYNMLLNAVNHTGDDKKVIVRIAEDENNVEVSVEDSGEGVSDADKPYIWDRYYKVDKEHKRSVVGNGLGLYIVKSIIEAHNGKYGVDDASIGGARFWIRIPK